MTLARHSPSQTATTTVLNIVPGLRLRHAWSFPLITTSPFGPSIALTEIDPLQPFRDSTNSRALSSPHFVSRRRLSAVFSVEDNRDERAVSWKKYTEYLSRLLGTPELRPAIRTVLEVLHFTRRSPLTVWQVKCVC